MKPKKAESNLWIASALADELADSFEPVLGVEGRLGHRNAYSRMCQVLYLSGHLSLQQLEALDQLTYRSPHYAGHQTAYEAVQAILTK